MSQEGTTSLRDTVTQAFEAAVEAPEGGTNEQQTQQIEQPSQTSAERSRDQKGRFAPANSTGVGDAPGKLEAKTAGDVQQQPTQAAQPAVDEPQQPERKPLKVGGKEIEWWKKPSSWKKEYDGDWESQSDALKQYQHQREYEFAKGVSTYKQEWEQARPLLDAIAPFMPDLQRNNINPAQWVQNLGNAHRILALGTPQDKVTMFQKLAADYQLPVALAVQGQDGQWQLLPQNAPAQRQPQQQPPDVGALVEQKFQEHMTRQEIAAFEKTHPYYEQVWQTMVGLLQSGLAEGLEDAYDVALKHPRHSDIYDELQRQQQATDVTKQREIADAKVTKQREIADAKAKQAKAGAVQVKGSTPRSSQASPGQKGVRAAVEAAFDEHATRV